MRVWARFAVESPTSAVHTHREAEGGGLGRAAALRPDKHTPRRAACGAGATSAERHGASRLLAMASVALHRPPRYGLLKDACTHKFDLLQRPFVRVSASAGVAPLDSPTEPDTHSKDERKARAVWDGISSDAAATWRRTHEYFRPKPIARRLVCRFR